MVSGSCAVAIIGSAGRFPGAADAATLWRNVLGGVESISTFALDELEDAVDAATRASTSYVPARAIVDDADRFDAAFFGIHRRDAERIDPQARLLLECAWLALEDAGYDPATYPGAIGVYAGASLNTYFVRNVLAAMPGGADRFAAEYPVGSYPELLGAGADFLTTRIAYKLDLRGPAMTVQSACSTSLLSVAQAVQTLMLGQADMMIAGGVSLTFPQKRGYLHQSGGMVASDGHCRTFDARASGTVFGDGVGMVVLKRLDDALADGDAIAAVIRGFGINNDAAAKIGFTAPSIDGQATAIRRAHEMAGFAPDSVSYIECHGTGTPLGDPIEVAALARAFAGAPQPIALSSIKPNVGHLDVAAGITGLIKATHALRDGVLPGTLHFEHLNPEIDCGDVTFVVTADHRPWPGDPAARRAGVSAFGVGGTNVHLALEAAPPPLRQSRPREAQLIVLSARSNAALETMRARLAIHLRTLGDADLPDIAATLARGRRAFAYRFACVAATIDEAVHLLEAPVEGERLPTPDERAVGFLFPGQGAQYVGMGAELDDRLPVFRAAIDRCAAIVDALGAGRLRDLLFPAVNDDAAQARLRKTEAAQVALFATEFALASVWESLGMTPAAMIGHSIGEFVAAVLAGTMTLDDALAIVCERGRLMGAQPGGAMLAVRASETTLAPMLGTALDIAAVNAPNLCVAAGPYSDIAALEERLTTLGIASRKLETSHAFHSAMMDPIVAPLRERVAAAPLHPPSVPLVSCISGDWIDASEATSPDYWARHARACVRFADAASALVAAEVTMLLEVGPGTALATFVRQGAARGSACRLAHSLPTTEHRTGELASMLAAAAQLWLAGAALDLRALFPDGTFTRRSLPGYAFERTRYWVGPEDKPMHQLIKSNLPITTPSPIPPAEPPAAEIERELLALFEDVSGESLRAAPPGATFLELGFDSLFLGRIVQHIAQKFGVTVRFRDLLGSLPSIPDLAAHLARLMPGDRRTSPAPVALAAPTRFDAFRITSDAAPSAFTPAQRTHIDALVAQTVARTPQSKAGTATYRDVLADPRVAAGFRLEWKEMVYPLTVNRAKGSRLWDIDGNEYIDLLNGFGQTAFGHSPDFVIDAVNAQLRDGFAIGPQADLAGRAAQLFCDVTGNERMTFCNTGSEAVMAAMRVARTVTGRDIVVLFEGAYHGQFDEVLVKRSRDGARSLPIAAGIPQSATGNVVVLQYGTESALDWLHDHLTEIAAVVVEPVQSRHPGLVPKAFLEELRAMTRNAGTALIFDEVVTGFRTHPGGMQAVLGIRADLATYGKVVGGGFPIGILAGTARFMDALDGGAWQYGDDSMPQVAPTFFAGTFVRHPVTLAAVLAVLEHVRANGPALQAMLTARTARLVDRLNQSLETRGIATRIERYASFFYLNLASDDRNAGLLYYHLRNRGIYLQEGFPCFLTTAHTEADVDAIVTAFDDSLAALQAVGILGATAPRQAASQTIALTESQIEIWLAAQAGDEASCAFNESVTLRMQGALDHPAFERAWRTVVKRHDALRATFSSTGEQMTIHPGREIPIDHVDIAEITIAAYIERDASRAFDLLRGPLVRVALASPTVGDHVFVLTAHHLICDGWSINVILEDLAAAYTVECGGAADLAPPASFVRYADADRNRNADDAAATDRYWVDAFTELPEPLELPGDRRRPPRKSFRGATQSAHIDHRQADILRAAGAREGATLFVTLLSAFSVLVGRLADRSDVVVGVPAAGQAAFGPAPLVGHCVNFLPIRTRWSRETRLADLLRAVKRAVLDAYDHQDYTLGTLVRRLNVPHALNRVPVTDVQFNLESLASAMRMPNLHLDVEPNPKAFVNFDLFLNVVESANGLRLDCEYSSDLFDAATVGRWLASYVALLTSFAGDAEVAVASVNMLAPDQRDRLERFNATDTAYPRTATVHRLIEEQTRLRPHAVALRCGDACLSYAELDERANRLAQVIVAQTGARALVGVHVARSLDMVVALLAVLKAGCAYVPLDPHHPKKRLRRILAEARIATLICDDAAAAGLTDAPTIDLRAQAAHIAQAAATPPHVPSGPDDLAYVISTSGSSGAPKGVQITHGNVVNLIAAMAQSPGVTSVDTMLAVTTIAFDIAGLELFVPLSVGGTVRIARSDDVSDGFALLEALRDATIMQATPATWRLVLEAGFTSSADLKMLCGGEALPRELADRLLAGGGELWNMYGPTETTIWSSCARIEPGAQAITIGRPIANTRMYVLDAHDALVAPGSIGQLHITGDGVGSGYLARPELTRERFVPNPFGTGTMYRTGDIARVLPSGDICILGRNDQQIKLRGFRIELGEIEAALENCGEVRGAAVVVREHVPGNPELVAYFVNRPGFHQTAASLRTALAAEVPAYMVPTVWMELDALPLSPAGKIDRSALPAPVASAPVTDAVAEALTPTEAALARIWAEVLHLDCVQASANLFSLGVDSLQIFAITARANAAGVRFAAKELFRSPTLADLARVIDEREPVSA